MAGIGLVILACFLWALDALIRYPLIGQGMPAVNIVFIEHSILVVLSIYVFWGSFKKLFTNKGKPIVYFFVVGSLGSALATLAFTRAFVFLNPSLVIILQKFQPLVAIILAKMFLEEKLSRQFLLWSAVCLLGAFLISFTDLQSAMTSYQTSGKSLYEFLFKTGAFKGYFLVALSVIGWGATTVFGKKLSLSGFDEKEIMAGRFTFGFLALLPFITVIEFNKELLSTNIYKILTMVMISGILAMYVYYQGLKRVSARACSLAELFFPFCAVIVNWIFLDAKLNFIQIIGGMVLLFGSFIIQTKKY